MNYQPILNSIYKAIKTTKDKGKVANYIPELSQVSTDNFGICLLNNTQETFKVGDALKPFSIQSISKVLALAKVFSLVDNDLWKRVDVEPSGNPFNHLSLLEHENGIPRNPLINSGALVIADILVSNLENPKEDFLQFIRTITNDNSIDYNLNVANSERLTGYRNYAAAYLLKSFGNLENDVEKVLDFYFHQCAIAMTCEQLTKAFFLFSNQGKCIQEKQILSKSQTKRINAIMLTCGFYDEAGEFAFEVGLPGKSGVGGGIVALLPNHFVISVWSPGLNSKGNSKLGMQALEKFTTETKISIF
ncbi:MAG: glutaminase [Flavobacteriaceae bacterium]|nr:glutaminase [Flavobacteriaceae bacterium]